MLTDFGIENKATFLGAYCFPCLGYPGGVLFFVFALYHLP
jgi:hypothetical protein